MKRPGVDGGFILCYGFNLILNGFWALPAVVLFILHFAAGIPLWAAGVALAAWLIVVLGVTAFMSWAVSTGSSNAAGTGTTGKVTIRRSSDRERRVSDRDGSR